MTQVWKAQEGPLKRKIIETCIFPIATYGCESWTISKADEKRIDAFEMKCYRKVLRIPWTEKASNASVLISIGLKDCQLMRYIKKQKLSYFGHIKRHESIEKTIMEGACEGKRSRGRPRRRWSQDIADWMGTTMTEAGRMAQLTSRGEFRRAIWEATSKKDPP